MFYLSIYDYSQNVLNDSSTLMLWIIFSLASLHKNTFNKELDNEFMIPRYLWQILIYKLSSAARKQVIVLSYSIKAQF